MDIQEIEVLIGKNGQVTLHVSGVQGDACLALTEELEQSLGNLILNRQMTSEAATIPEAKPANVKQRRARVKRQQA
jgi:hypothetical protein